MKNQIKAVDKKETNDLKEIRESIAQWYNRDKENCVKHYRSLRNASGFHITNETSNPYYDGLRGMYLFIRKQLPKKLLTEVELGDFK